MEYYFLKPGAIFVSYEPTLIHTVLGSCVAVCIFDMKRGLGGMNHFIYHHAHNDIRSCRYGDIAVPCLLKVMSDMGGESKDFIAHIIGGSRNIIPSSIIGEDNVKIAKQILKLNNIRIGVTDTDGNYYRKIIFNNISGDIDIKKGVMRT